MGDELPDLELQPFGNKASKSKEAEEKCVDSELWQACAGKVVKMPATNSLVYYFPQGHAEHAQCSLNNIETMINPPPSSKMLCRVESVKLMADPETDEVFAKIGLAPITIKPGTVDPLVEEEIMKNNDDSPDEELTDAVSFATTLSPSNIKGKSYRLYLPLECVNKIFPELKDKKDPLGQYISCIDVHGKTWMFCFTRAREQHFLSIGWNIFRDKKKLAAGDAIVFLRKENGEIHVGTRKKNEELELSKIASTPSNLNSDGVLNRISSRRMKKESVIKAMKLASSGESFEIVYYPRAGTPEYCVKAALVREAETVPWRPGMSFKMVIEFEAKNNPGIGLFLGTIRGIEAMDQNQWPNSLWRKFEVKWDGTLLPKDVTRVNPWLVKPVSKFSFPPAKMLCLQSPSSSSDCTSTTIAATDKSTSTPTPAIKLFGKMLVPLSEQIYAVSTSGNGNGGGNDADDDALQGH